MAKFEGRPSISASIVIVLTEEEAGALDALAGYGTQPFLDAFYREIGSSYLAPYEGGLRSLFDSVRNGPCSVRAILQKAREARQVFSGQKVAVDLPKRPEG